MSSFQDIEATTGLAVEGNFEAHRDVNININKTTNYSTAKNEPRIWKPFCTVPASIPLFSGREDLIAEIHRQIQKCSKQSEYSKKIVVIHGLGGIGKSEIVRKYVQTHLKDPVLHNAALINAESKHSLESSFKSLAKKLNLKTKDEEFEDIVSSIYSHLEEHNQPSLFIFDNAEQMRSEDGVFGIFEFLPTTQLDIIPLIIITSRFKDWQIPEENILEINELSEDAAVEFLKNRFKLSPEQKGDEAIMDALKDLARSLQCFPLGLTLAASNIPHSKLRSIPNEIKDYIQKINSPHEGWIHERQSAGTAGKYDLIMNNVWEATLDKIKSKGDDGEAAISLLNMMAFFSPDEITVENVVDVAEFSGLLTSTAGLEMLKLYSLISLPSSTNTRYQRIRIHRLVQRCTRDNLDREKNYTHLLTLSMYLSQKTRYTSQIETIHQHLKERMWPKNSIQSSILFASTIYNLSDKYEIVKDVHEVLARDEKPGYAQNLAEDYKILHALNLFYLSTYTINYNKLCEDLISKDSFYSKKYLKQVFVSSLGKSVKDLFTGTMDTENSVKRTIFRVLIDIVPYESCQIILSEEVQEEMSLKLADATSNSFEGSVETVGELYSLLWKSCCCFNRISVCWYVETVLKIHGSVYASIKETGGDQLDSYWENDKPFPYKTIGFALMKDSNAEWNRCFQESFCTEAGLQLLLHHLLYVDALTQTKIDRLPYNAQYLFGWKWNCMNEFVQANLFMETLYSLTKNLFKLNAEDFYAGQFWCLMAWFGIFGTNTCVDLNGVSWSIQSVEKEMILFLDTADRSTRRVRSAYISSYWNSEDVLYEFIESSGRDQDSIADKTALWLLALT